jgi:phosphohistidine phosphatase
VTLYLIRHAEAEERRDGLLDHDRRLTNKGHAQARRLALALEKLGVRFDALISSPLIRAVETADALATLATKREKNEHLAQTPNAVLLELIRKHSGSIGLVGHEPYMSQLVSLLLFGTLQHADGFEFKKAALYVIEWPEQPHLTFVLPPSVVKRLGQD